jgi:hypothetical protein
MHVQRDWIGKEVEPITAVSGLPDVSLFLTHHNVQTRLDQIHSLSTEKAGDTARLRRDKKYIH